MASGEEIKTQFTVGGDKEFSAALKDINAQLRLQKSDMAAATSAYAKNDASMEALKTRSESLANVYKTQGDKVQLLQNQLEKAKSEYGENSDQARSLQISLNKATAEMNKTKLQLDDLDSAMEEAADSTGELGDEAGDNADNLADLEKGAKGAAKEVDGEGKKADDAKDKNSKLGDALKKVGEIAGKTVVAGAKAAGAALAALSAAAAAGVKAGFDLAKGAGTYADDLLTLSSTTGISAQSLQEWAYAANFIDVSVDTVTGSMTKMTKGITGGSKETTKAMKTLGISAKDSSGNWRSMEDVFFDTVDARFGHEWLDNLAEILGSRAKSAEKGAPSTTACSA